MASHNQLHDVLFSKARVVLNNNVKRLWFKINPFLERKETLQNYSQPDKLTKFVQLLQSSVVCERYFSEESTTHQNVGVEEFWDFLYSDKWSHGCSIRVLEGQLLDCLLTSLYVLEQADVVGHHNTFAFAKNQRERRGCYKLSNIEKGCEIIEETLLLEFTYYGRKTEKISKKFSSSTPYPGTTTESPIHTIDEEDEEVKSRPMQLLSKSRKRKKSIFQYNFDPFSSQTFKRNSIFQEEKKENTDDLAKRLDFVVKSGCISDAPEQLANTLKGWMEPKPKSPSSPEETSPSPTKPNIEIISRTSSDDTKSSQVSTDSDYKLKAKLPNLSKLPCSERVYYGDGYHSVDIVDDVKSLEEVETGQEFYLGDTINSTLEKDVSVETKLKNRLKERQQMREEQKHTKKQWAQQQRGLPKYKEIDFEAIRKAQKPKAIPERTPTFEEFLHLLEEEEKYDPRFRKAKQMTKKIAKRYNIQRSKMQMSVYAQDKKPGNGYSNLPLINMKPIRKESKMETGDLNRRYTMEFAHEVGGVTDSRACEKWIVDQYGRKVQRHHNVGFSPYLDFHYGRAMFSDYTDYDSPEVEIPTVLLTTPSGIITELASETDSDAVPSVTPNLAESKARLPPISPAISSPEEKRETPSPKSSSRLKSTKSRKSSVMHRKKSSKKAAVLKELDERDKSSESEAETEDANAFDTKKLNLKYSFERLRGKTVKKKPSFYEVLKKYYKLQRVVTKFTGDRRTGRRKGIFARLLKMPPEEEIEAKDKFVVGKMKKFDFLENKMFIPDQDENVSFATPSLVNFTSKVLKALDDFVVRKEQVVSDYCGKSSMTLTFTRKSVFNFNLS